MYILDLKPEHFQEFLAKEYKKFAESEFAILNTEFSSRVNSVGMIMHVISLDTDRDITKIIAEFTDFECRFICGINSMSCNIEWQHFTYSKLREIEGQRTSSSVSQLYKQAVRNTSSKVAECGL